MDSGTENGSVRMRRLALAGVIGPVLSVAVFSVAGALRPGYSPMRQAISALDTWQWSTPHPPDGTFARAVDPARYPTAARRQCAVDGRESVPSGARCGDTASAIAAQTRSAVPSDRVAAATRPGATSERVTSR